MFIQINVIKSRLMRTASLFLMFMLLNLKLKAECDPVNDPTCDIDLPLDKHVWVLMLITLITSVYLLKKKQAVQSKSIKS